MNLQVLNDKFKFFSRPDGLWKKSDHLIKHSRYVLFCVFNICAQQN